LRDLANNFDNFIPLFWQSSSGYVGMPSPNYSVRGGMYGVSGIPHARFGGYISEVGGMGSGSMYNYYLPHYNTLNALDSPLSIDISMDLSTRSTVDIQADVEVTSNITTTNNKLIFLLSYKYNDDYTCAVVAYHEVNFNLTTVGQTETFTHSFTYDPDWIVPDLRGVVLVQTFSGNLMILQAATCGVDGLFPMFSSNVQSGPPELGVQFYNESYPSTGITSYEWDFDGDGTWDSTEENPYFLYDAPGSYDVILRISDGIDQATTTAEDFITVTSTSNIIGDLSGVWTETYSPYTITDNVNIKDEATLEIGPNVEVRINNSSKMTVEGTLLVAGDERGNVLFTTDNNWKGIYFFLSPYDNLLSYATFTNCTESAVDINNSTVTVTNCTFYENSTTTQKGPAINVLNSDDVEISWSKFANNTSTSLAGAISLDNSSPLIERNIIVNNEANFAGAFSLKNTSSPDIINNTIANNLSNWAAFYMFSDSNPNIENCIIISTEEVFINFSCAPIVNYTNLSGGYTGTGNIDVDPLFVNPTAGDGPTYDGLAADWSLQENSPCIDAGNPASPPDPDGTIADMGALYYHQNVSVDEPHAQDILIQNYPNPFVHETTISYSLPAGVTTGSIEIYNIKGELVKQFELNTTSEDQNVTWNGLDEAGNGVANGIYFYKLETDTIERIEKMILMK